ncbi:MAG: SpoIIE family protein phosphatase [Planctomycetaceae bacterium]
MTSGLLANPECCWSTELQAGDQTVGFLHIDLPRDPGLDQSFLAVCDLGKLFSKLAGRTLAASQALEAMTQDMATWADVSMSTQEDDFLTALKKLLKAVTQLTGFRAASFFMLTADAQDLKLRMAHNPELGEIPRSTRSLSDRVPDYHVLMGEPVLLNTSRSPEAQEWLPRGTSTGYCVPVQSEAGMLGTLWAFDRRDRIPAERECHVLQSLAARIATTLERAVLLRESELQHRQQHDLNIASESQSRDVLKDLPDDLDFDIAAVCTSRFELGGDLCELIPLDETRTIIAVGDASGDSVPAAMVMSAARGALRALSSQDADESSFTERMMRRLNQTLYSLTPSHQFMSLILGVLDSRQKTFLYTNAGHPAPLLIRGNKSIELDSHGMLLGVVENSDYTHSALSLQGGDILVAFSDGISEAMNNNKSLFRQDGIAASVIPPEGRTASELLQAIWDKMESHIGSAEHGDDRTLLVLKLPS